MTRHIIISLLTILVLRTSGQTFAKCNCNAIVDIKSQDILNVYDKPNGQTIKTFRNNVKDENYLVLTILGDSADFFKVNISYALTENSSVSGWTNKTNVIGTYARNYSSALNLYSSPDINSKVRTTIPEWTNGLFIIDKCHGEWAYVKINYKGQIKEGWLQPDKQCANSYSNCN